MDRNVKIKSHQNQNFTDIMGSAVSIKSFNYEKIYSEEYLRWLRDPEVLVTLNLTSYLEKPIDVGEVEQYCHALIESESNIFCAVHERHTDLFVGTCKIGGINEFSGIADIGIMIGEKRFWGKGIGSETVSLLSNYAFNELNLRKLTGGAMSSNKPMLNIFARLGFVEEGVRRKQDRFGSTFVDHVLFGCFRDEFKPLLKR